MKKTFHIHLSGKVQGVGFRPFVYLLAQNYGLAGWVCNGNDGLRTEVSGEEDRIRDFYYNLIQRAPDIALITGHTISEVDLKETEGFSIIESDQSGEKNILLTSDLDVCEQCLSEFYDPTHPRYHYPFTSCTYCGPRFSILHKMPYDRVHTTMKAFKMCESCEKEYHSPSDRRFFSQINTCPACPVQLTLTETRQRNDLQGNEEAFLKTLALLEEGNIVAIKGIGGYLLLVDASNSKSIIRLRDRKHRPSKPFALMYPDVQSVRKDMLLSEEEERQLLSREKPILLLQKKAAPFHSLFYQLIAPESDLLGVMLPYTPLFHRLSREFKKPLIATSGNISHAPVVFKDEQALEELSAIADAILLNDREIVQSQDDSVLRFSPMHQQRIILRRSRGFAPNFIHSLGTKIQIPLLAMGAMQKGTFGLVHQQNIYISQYLGDLDSYEGEENYKQTLRHFQHLFDFQPEVILVDKHHGYFTTQWGHQLAREAKIPCIEVQHHEAHFYAVMAENKLMEREEPVLGVIWDGTGYGNDKNIWGGEFFVYRDAWMHRAEHFPYFNHLLGDKMALEPRLSALSLCFGKNIPEELLRPRFSALEWDIYHRLLEQKKHIQTSSAGRVFDAIASLLGLADKITFEGEAAMKLERIAQKYWILTHNEAYYTPCLQPEIWLQEMLFDLHGDLPKGAIALKFHWTLVKVIEQMAYREQCPKIAFSGGVFQNALLVDLLILGLGKNFELYFHRQLAPNDENISLGQIAYYLHHEEKHSSSKKNHPEWINESTDKMTHQMIKSL